MASELKHDLTVLDAPRVRLLDEYPYRNSVVGTDGLVRPLVEHTESVAGREHRRVEKIKTPSFGESSRKVKIYYAFDDGSFFPLIRTPFAVTPTITSTDNYQRFTAKPIVLPTESRIEGFTDKGKWTSRRNLSEEWQQRQQLARRLADASVELIPSEELERYRIGLLNQTAHDSATSWASLAKSKRLLSPDDWLQWWKSSNERLIEALSYCTRRVPIPYFYRSFQVRHLRSVADVGNYALGDGWIDTREPVSESGFAIDAPTFPARAAHPSITQGREFWREESESARLRHFELLDEPRRAGFFHGLPLVEWITDSVEAELHSLRVTAERRAFACCVAFLHPPVGKIEFQGRTEYSAQPTDPTRFSERANKEEIKKWNRTLLTFKDKGKRLFPQEPHTLGGFHFRGFPRRGYPSTVYAESAGGNEMSEENRINRIESYEDDEEPINPDHARSETDWIENREPQNDDPVDPTELKQQVRLIFNPDKAERSEKKIAEIKAHRLFDAAKKEVFIKTTNRTEGEYYMKETGRRASKRKLNAIAQQNIRDKKEFGIRAVLAEIKSFDPEFVIAFEREMAKADFKPEEGFYFALPFKNGPQLHRLDCSFDSQKHYPIGSGSNIRRHAFFKLWRTNRKKAMQNARSNGKSVQAARQRIDQAFLAVRKRIHYFGFLA